MFKQKRILLKGGDNMKRYLALFLILLTFSLLLCGCKETPHGTQESGTEAESEYLGTGTVDPSEPGFKIPTLQERTAWNIELELYKIDENGIWITITDYDNQGFEYNTLYFVLERYENGEWVKLTRLKEYYANTDVTYVFPHEDVSYIDTNNLNFFPSYVEFSAGHYRLTKVLSGREFSLEFDYEPQ